MGDKYEEIKVLKKTGNLIKSKRFSDCWKEYTQELKQGIYKSKNTSSGYFTKGKLLVDFFKSKNVGKLNYDDLKELVKLLNEKIKQQKHEFRKELRQKLSKKAKEFKKENYTQGIIDGIQEVGEQLKQYFPIEENDMDELTTEISKG